MTQFFETPALLPLAVVLPLVVALVTLHAYRRRRTRLTHLAEPALVERLLTGGPTTPAARKVILLTTAAMLCGIAAAGPRWGRSNAQFASTGIDVVLALDASLSMMATDERPTRLDRMKQEVRRLRAVSSGDRIGVIAFAGRSYIMSPLTTDDGALDLFIDAIDPSIVGQAGSSVSRAINQGADLLAATASLGDRALVLMSDFESFEPESEALAAAKRAAEMGIHVVVVGFGTGAGSRIPIEDGGRNRFKLDELGRTVVTQHNAELMRGIAAAAGGVAIEAFESDKSSRIRRALSALRTHQRNTRVGADLTPRHQLFLVPALILLLVDTLGAFWLERGKLLRAAANAGRRSVAATAMVVVAVTPAQMQDRTEDRGAMLIRQKDYMGAVQEYRRLIAAGEDKEQNLYNLGTALLLADSVAGAAAVLTELSRSGNNELRFRALFNAGTAQLLAGLRERGERRTLQLDGAVESYRAALLMRPNDLNAKWNYELALSEKAQGSGSGDPGPEQQSPSPESTPQSPSEQQPRGSLGREQAQQILDNAARDERDVQSRSQERNRPAQPPGGKDW